MSEDPAAGAQAEAERVLETNWTEGERQGTAYAYTRPSPTRYPWQWYWDSCFAAIARRRLDPARAAAELRTLIASGREDGFIGHTTFWDRPVEWIRLPFYNVDSRRAFRTGTIQPPLLAWAWSLAVGDPRDEPAIARHHEWLAGHRDLESDGLLWIIQPDESGLDSSPKFDPIWRRRAHARTGFIGLVARNRRLGWDARRILDAGGPLVCETVTNTLWALSVLAMGGPSITPALVDRLWDERSGIFRDDVLPALPGAAPETWASLAPLALPDLPEPIGRRIVEEHLLDPARFWTPVAPPSVAANEPSFERGASRGPLRRYWRGPTWVNAAWLLWLGLSRLGYDEQAAQLSAGIIDTVAREGLREYYDPFSGRGFGARDFAWTALVLEMLDAQRQGGRYL